MSDFTTALAEDRNRQAFLLHNKIMASGITVAQSLLQMCKDLKTMRDEKLYTELGYKDFGVYCDEAVGIGARQGYTYIQAFEKMGSDFIEKHSSLGITKLSLLAKMNPVDCIEAVESGIIEGMSVKEVKELVAKSTAQSEQLSLLSAENESLKSENRGLVLENSELEESCNDLMQENKELKARPTEILPESSEEQIEAIRKEFEVEKEAALKAERDKLDKKINKAKAEAEKTANQNKDKEIAEAVKKAKAEAEAENAELRSIIDSFKAENAKLENQIKASDSNVQKVNIYFGAFQENLNKALSAMGEMQGEQKEKMTVAIKTALQQIIEKIGG